MPKTDYSKRLKIPLDGNPSTEFYSFSNTLLAVGYDRIVIGQRGPYIEFSKNQIQFCNFYIPADCSWRLSDKRVYYIEYRSADKDFVKLYDQLKTVAYADYKIGKLYISPFLLKTHDLPTIIDAL